MNPVYAIFGYEWSTNEKGAAPEISEYLALEVIPKETSWVKIAVNCEFLRWKTTARQKIWEKIYPRNVTSYDEIANAIESLKRNSETSWYFITKEEFDSWVENGTESKTIILES